uniref:Lipocalin 11 n=1 Tax=Nannospalax galili TaxID=1026970 RepID=A0A8C6RKB3_NANGA
ISTSHGRGMKSLLLLSIGLGRAWAQPGFHPEQVEGPWTTFKLGSTDQSVIEEGGAYCCFMTGITLLENGNLNITYFHRKDEKCVKDFYIAEKTDTPGRYTFEYQGKNYLTFVVVTNDITIIDLDNHSDSSILMVVELHGRTLSLGGLGLEPYRKHTSRRGISQGNVVDLSLYCPACATLE